ncbi:hypothetical protein [Corynebacterium glaucum]|uniref:hypothetical protein n=1 Tax=Corynebacterium glaucum TaxID=187491 RepID=UPI0025B3639E|nr:hypothetical protein [Corynebacterium glaucum]WJZ07837.1 hypothetical protein CGLAUT_06745 [Corynebacterium glaucum]
MSSFRRSWFFCTLVSARVLAGCNAFEHVESLDLWLEDQSGSSASVMVADLLPESKQTAIVCPYSGKYANEFFGETVFTGHMTSSDAVDWLAWKSTDGAFIAEELSHTRVEVCRGSGHSYGVRELQPRETLVFTKEAGVWRLTEIR